MNEVLNNITSSEDTLIPVVMFIVGGVIAIIAIIFTSVKRISISNDREKSRREIAAYVAEGSMTPEDAEKILKASPKDS